MSSEREEIVRKYLEENGIAYSCYHHPAGATIAEASLYWRKDGSLHCKNLFFRNHKGNRHYLVCFPAEMDLPIHDLEHLLKQGKLSFASPERMLRYLGLEPGSVSPFGLINDCENHVHLFMDKQLHEAPSLSFHPNDCRGTIVIDQANFQHYLQIIGNSHTYLDFSTLSDEDLHSVRNK